MGHFENAEDKNVRRWKPSPEDTGKDTADREDLVSARVNYNLHG
jgi:hypothetical protein